jgi:hypothetical protein
VGGNRGKGRATKASMPGPYAKGTGLKTPGPLQAATWARRHLSVSSCRTSGSDTTRFDAGESIMVGGKSLWHTVRSKPQVFVPKDLRGSHTQRVGGTRP